MKVIVFGATGAVGLDLVTILSNEHADWQILAVTSNLKKESHLASMKLPNVKMVEGNAFDKDSVVSLSKSCDLVFSCLGFPRYERKYWATQWPLVVDNLLEACKEKKLIFCDNIYAYGTPKGPISPNTPTVAPSLKSKPAIRALLHKRFHQHMKEYPGTLSVVGAADFFGPHVTNVSFLGDTFTGKIVSGGSPLAIGSADKVHDFCFTTDFAAAMAKAALSPKAYDRFWIAPHSVHGKTMAQLATDIAKHAGQYDSQKVNVTVLPKWLVYTLSPFMGFMSEIVEMLPQWTEDYAVDDSEFIREFGLAATPYDEAIQAYVSFYQNLPSS